MAEFNRERANVVLGQLIDAYRRKEGLYGSRHQDSGASVQKRFIPEGLEPGSLEHQMYLFLANVLDYRAKSSEVHDTMRRLYEDHRFIFIAQFIPEIEVRDLLREYGYAAYNDGAYRFTRTRQFLWEELKGHPRRIFSRGKSIDEIHYSFRHFRFGYGTKLLSLLAIYYHEFIGMRFPQGTFPVDRHVIGICQSTGILELSEGETPRSTDIEKLLRPNLYEWCMNHRVGPDELSHALWFVGNGLCGACEARGYRTRPGMLPACSIHENCGGRQVDQRGYNDVGRISVKEKTARPRKTIVFVRRPKIDLYSGRLFGEESTEK